MPVIDNVAFTQLEQEIARQEQVLYRPGAVGQGHAACPLCSGVIDWSKGPAGALRLTKPRRVVLICHACTANLVAARAAAEGR